MKGDMSALYWIPPSIVIINTVTVILFCKFQGLFPLTVSCI
jgi:hypothetical protein